MYYFSLKWWKCNFDNEHNVAPPSVDSVVDFINAIMNKKTPDKCNIF